MKFTLTFEGPLTVNGPKAVSKHARRRIFHRQLKRLWRVNTNLADWHLPVDKQFAAPAPDVLAARHGKFSPFQFVPLVSKDVKVDTALHFHILRPTDYRNNTADPDNIIKIIVDSLKMPQAPNELPAGVGPSKDESPFYALLEDDGLISRITSVSDELLQPIMQKDVIERSDTRILIDVYIRPLVPTVSNLIFFSDHSDVWNHQWSQGIYDNIQSWSNSELKARTTQCILRMRVIGSNFRMSRTTLHSHWGRSRDDIEAYTQKLHEDSDERHAIWNNGLRPAALVLLVELERRVFGEAPYRSDYRLGAVKDGMLAGVDPILDAAEAMYNLVCRLP